MTEKEEEICWYFLMRLAFLCGELACTISEDQEHKKWLAVSAKYTRDRLIELQSKFVEEMFPNPPKK